MSQVQPRFDPNDPKYICCCGLHVLTGAKMLASLCTICAVLSAIKSSGEIFLSSTADPQTDEAYYTLLVKMGFSLIIGTPILGCLWYGLIKEREGFLIPTLVCSVISVVLTGLLGGFLAISGNT
uniref:DUF7027 domain-containing protein n=1 Tax=Plectus sambesii TaxID=2011161 RepID=A0A914UJV5_9BILA